MSDVFANNRSILHKGDGNQHISGPPDVCKTPSPGGPVPIPYPNMAMDSNLASGAKKVKINGNPVAHEGSNLSTSTGDEPGTAGGGILSSKFKGKMRWGSSSGDVKVEGKGVVRFMDVTEHNGNVWNTVIVAGGEPSMPSYGDDPIDGRLCSLCGRSKNKHKIGPDEVVLPLAQQLAQWMKEPASAFYKSVRRPNVSDPSKDVILKNKCMIGVLTCRCGDKKYAGLAGSEYEDNGFEKIPPAFEQDAKHIDSSLIAVVDFQPPPLSGQFAPKPPSTSFGPMPAGTWKRLDKKARAGKKGRGNVPLTCAGPKMIQRCLRDGHKPSKMVEILVGMKPNQSVTIPWLRVVTFDKRTTPWKVTVDKDPQKGRTFHDGEAVPSCTACQITLTAMLCKLDKSPCE